MSTGTQSQREVGRRALLDHVKKCIAQTNEMTKLAGKLREEHNKTVDALRKQKERADALYEFLREVRRKNAEAEAERDAFDGLSVWQRFRWFVTGRWPRPARTGEGIAALTAPTSNAPTYAGIDLGASKSWSAVIGQPTERHL